MRSMILTMPIIPIMEDKEVPEAKTKCFSQMRTQERVLMVRKTKVKPAKPTNKTATNSALEDKSADLLKNSLSAVHPGL